MSEDIYPFVESGRDKYTGNVRDIMEYTVLLTERIRNLGWGGRRSILRRLAEF